VALGPAGSTALEGGEVRALQLAPAQLRGRLTAPLEPQQAGSNPVLRQMLELELAGQRELQRLRSQLAPLPPRLELAQGGCDTHSNQAGRHGRVLAELAEALAAPFLGTDPSLTTLDDRGDLIAGISPPELYRQVLAGVWG